MKTISIYSILAALAIWSVTAGYQVMWHETPAVVRGAIQHEAGNAAISEIDRQLQNGKVVYEVTLKGNGLTRTVRFDQAGNQVDAQGNRVGTSVPLNPETTTKVAFDQVPLVAQNAIKAQTGAAPIEAIDREVRLGRTTYSAIFRRNGQLAETRVTEDGATVVNFVDLPANVQTALRAKSSGFNIQDVEVRPRGLYTIRFQDGHSVPVTLNEGNLPISSSPPPVIASSFPEGSAKVTLDQLPAEVRAAILGHAGASPIEDIDRETRGGKTTYNAAFKRNGQNMEIVVADDGALLLNLAELPVAVQNSIRTQLGTMPIERIEKRSPRGRDLYVVRYTQNGQPYHLRIDSNGQLVERGLWNQNTGAPGSSVIGRDSSIALPDKKVSMAELPLAAQNAIRAEAQGAEIEDIDRQTRNGQTTYEASFKRAGRTVDVKVSSDGVVLSRP